MIKSLYKEFSRDENLTPIIFLSLIIMLGSALRLYDLGAESYWFDETIMLSVAKGSLSSIFAEAQGGRPPVYVLLAHFWIQAFGTTEVATRSLSAIAGIGCLPLMYAVGRELFGRKVALISTLLMAISEFQICFSQDFRYYAVHLLMALCSFFFYIRALKTGKISHFTLYVIFSILLFYSHTFGIFALMAQGLYFLMQWKRHRELIIPWLLSQILILLAIGPGLLLFLGKSVSDLPNQAVETNNYLPYPSLWFPVVTLLKYIFPGPHGRSWQSIGLTLIAGMAFFTVGTLLFAVLKGKEEWLTSVKGLFSVRKGVSSTSNELLLVFCWFLCPILVASALSALNVRIYYKYTIAASPAFYILLALGITTVRKVVPEVISLGLLLILIAPGLHLYYVTDVNEQWAEVAEYLGKKGMEGDVIVIAPDAGGWASGSFGWYYRGDLPTCGMRERLRNNQQAMEDTFAKCISGKKRVWLIMLASEGVTEQFKVVLLNRIPRDLNLVKELEFRFISVLLFDSRSKITIGTTKQPPTRVFSSGVP